MTPTPWGKCLTQPIPQTMDLLLTLCQVASRVEGAPWYTRWNQVTACLPVDLTPVLTLASARSARRERERERKKVNQHMIKYSLFWIYHSEN